MGWVPVREGVIDPPEWVEVGDISGPKGDPGNEVLPYSMAGPLAARPGQAPYPVSGGTFTIETVAAMVGLPPMGAPVTVDVNVNGASIYPDQTHRPTIPSGQRAAAVGAHSEVTLTDGDYITVDVDTIGTALAGADLTVVVRLNRTV